MCQKGYDMKRYFALIAAAALLLTGCQSGKTDSPEESSGVTSTAEQTAASDVTSAESAPDTQPEDPTVPTAEAQTAESPDSAESTVFRPAYGAAPASISCSTLTAPAEPPRISRWG